MNRSVPVSVRFGWLVPLAITLLTGTRASAQVLSAAHTVALSVTKTSAISISTTANPAQSIPSIADGGITNFGPGAVGLTTQWDLKPGQTAGIRLVGYFASAVSALSNGAGSAIPSAQVEAQMTTVAGMPWTKFNQAAVTVGAQTVGTNGASLLFWDVPISGTNKTSSRADQLALRLNLTGQPVLPVGTYTGTLYLRVISY